MTNSPIRSLKPCTSATAGGSTPHSTTPASIWSSKKAVPLPPRTPTAGTPIDRIRNEYDKLTHLADNPYTPSAISLFEREGHHFLVTERAAGTPLNQEVALRHPLIRADQTLSSRTEYRTWALDIAQQLTTAVESFHNAGIVHADLHPGNVMCSPVRYSDHRLRDGPQHRRATAPVHRGSRVHSTSTVDRNRGGSNTRWDASSWDSFVPLTTLFPLDCNKIPELIDYAVSRFDLPRAFVASLYSMLDIQAPEPENRPHRWDTSPGENLQRAAALLRCGILASLDLSRPDRLFPGDIAQFEVNGYGIAHGSCGNLLADVLPADTLESVLEWTEHQVDSDTQPKFGFFDGLAGAVHAFRQLGRHSTADRWVETLCKAPLDEHDSSLFGGLSGIGVPSTRGIGVMSGGIVNSRSRHRNSAGSPSGCSRTRPLHRRNILGDNGSRRLDERAERASTVLDSPLRTDR